MERLSEAEIRGIAGVSEQIDARTACRLVAAVLSPLISESPTSTRLPMFASALGAMPAGEMAEWVGDAAIETAPGGGRVGEDAP
jgi:hypothetical protein